MSSNLFKKQKWNSIKDIKKYQDEVFETTKQNHSMVSKIDFEQFKSSSNKNIYLDSIPFSFKDNFSTHSQRTTAGTLLLQNFYPNIDSTVFVKLTKAGAIPLFSSNLDELAMGGSGLNSNYGKVFNFHDKERLNGGSSSGSAFQQAAGHVGFAIGSDTGDSVRKPAAYSGVVGFKPTWGIVSRHGLFDFAPSWDTVSWFTDNVSEAAILLDVLVGKDLKDMSSVETSQKDFYKNISINKKIKLCYFKNLIKDLDSTVEKNWNKTLNKLKENGIDLVPIEVDINLFSTILPMYRVISSLEAFSCNSNLTGFLFGEKGQGENFEQQITDARSKGFAYEVKKRFLWGNYVIHKTDYYSKALKIRKKIIDFLDQCFKSFDGIIMPSTPTVAPKVLELSKHNHSNLLEDYLAIYNANGSPSISIPNYEKEKELPTSINISTAPFKDLECLQIAYLVENLIK